jgi:hypothetical protein
MIPDLDRLQQQDLIHHLPTAIVEILTTHFIHSPTKATQTKYPFDSLDGLPRAGRQAQRHQSGAITNGTSSSGETDHLHHHTLLNSLLFLLGVGEGESEVLQPPELIEPELRYAPRSCNPLSSSNSNTDWSPCWNSSLLVRRCRSPTEIVR